MASFQSGRGFYRSALFLSLVSAASLFAEEAPVAQYNPQQVQMDIEALRKELNERKIVSLKKMNGELTLSGEVGWNSKT